MRRLYLRDCTPGDVLEDVYVVSGKQLGATTTGKHFIKAFISDRTCQLTARMWNATRDIFASMPESGFLRLRGRVENYQNNLQFIIEQMWAAKDGSFEVEDLMPHTAKDIDRMCQRVFEICQSVQNRHLAALLQAYLDDEELMNSFCRAPAAMSFHHAYIGGLLEHTLNAMEVADAIVRFYPGLSRDLVVAGIFLHDIAKTWELAYDCAFNYTDAGQLVGHIVKSAMWVEHKARQAEQTLGERIPQPLIDVLQHIIVSHHGTPEFGAVKIPATPEAIAVHFIENLDAKLMMSLSATRGESVTGEGKWTEYMKQFGVRLFRPDVCGDVEDGEAIETKPAPVVAPAPASKNGAAKPPVSATQAPQPAAHPRTNGDGHPQPPQHAPQHAPQPLSGGRPAITNPLFESVPARKK
jgi:3'-5' exoribonuclease